MTTTNYMLTLDEVVNITARQATGLCAATAAKVAYITPLAITSKTLQERLEYAQEQKTQADSACYIETLGRRVPPIVVPSGSTIMRQMIDGNDTLTVISP